MDGELAEKEEEEDAGDADPIQLYLKEIRKIPLLTPSQEIELARKVKKGDAQARKRMIQANLRLVVAIAKRYMHFGMSLLDLVEEGNLGLMKAVERYDPSKGYRFSTYASWWIRQSITRALANQGTLVRIPVYMTELLHRCRRVTEELYKRSGRPPDAWEVARKMRISIGKVQQLQELALMPASLDMPLGEDGVGQLLDIVEDRLVVSPARQLEDVIRHERVMGVVSVLPEREAKLIRLRYGLDDGLPRTLEETGKNLHLTRERIRQIEAVALRRLRLRLDEADRKVAERRKR